MTLTSRYGKFNQENMYQTLSESALFCKRCDKTFWCVFSFTVLTAVHLQNVHAEFHKVGQRHYSGEAENVNISVWQILKFTKDNMYQMLSQSVRFYRLYIKNKTFWCVFSVHSVDSVSW